MITDPIPSRRAGRSGVLSWLPLITRRTFPKNNRIINRLDRLMMR